MKKIFPFFSIIIPTFNRVRFLDLTIRSIIRQNFTSYEIIISDNASTDGTKDLVLRYQKQGYPISYHRFKHKVAPQRNVLKGFYLAKGKYIFMLGDDDAILKIDTLKKIYQQANRYHPGFMKISVIFYYENLETINDIYKGLLLPSGNKHIPLKYPALPLEMSDKFLEFISGSIYKNDRKLLSYLNHDDVLYFSLPLIYELSFRYGAVFLGNQYIIGRYFETGHFFYNFIEPKFSLDTLLNNAKNYLKDSESYQIFDQKQRRSALLHVVNWRLILSPKLLAVYINKIYIKDKWRYSNAVYYIQALILRLVPKFILLPLKRIYIFWNKKSIKNAIITKDLSYVLKSFINNIQ